MCAVVCIWQTAEVRSVCCRQLVGSNRVDGQGDAAEAAADLDIRDSGAFPAAIGSNANGVNRFAVAASMLVKALAHMCLPVWQVDFKEPTPAGEELIVRSQVVEVRDRQPRGAKSSVQVGSLRVPVSPFKNMDASLPDVSLRLNQEHAVPGVSSAAHVHTC